MGGKESRKRYVQRRQLRLRAEIIRGMQESREAIAKLQSTWPAAFPAKSHLVKPLALGLLPVIAERMGWGRWYVRGVLRRWKERDAYCNAVLCHGQRFDLDGKPVDEVIDDAAKEMARQQLARNAKRRVKNEARAASLKAPSEAASIGAAPSIS